MRKKRTTPPTALTDIAFLLLLFFLILAVSTRQVAIPIEPATGEAVVQDLKDIPILLVGSDGSLFLDNKPVLLDSIPTSDSYTLLADKETPFSVLSPIIEHLKQQGIKTLHCVVEGQS